jgi:putative membrane-bound dehydrogenase-like protein
VVAKYGSRVRFVTFAEVEKRLNRHLLAGHPLRAANGQDNGVRVLDVNNDGFMDVVIANEKERRTRIWSPENHTWIETGFPVPLIHVDGDEHRTETGVRFGVFQPKGQASFVINNNESHGVWHFENNAWELASESLDGLNLDGPVHTAQQGRDRGVRLIDLDSDGICELIVGNESQSGAFEWQASSASWARLPFSLPAKTQIVTSEGRDAGLRFADVDEDGHLDVLFSNATRYSLHLFRDLMDGWSRVAINGARGSDTGTQSIGPEILVFVRADGSNNGAWIKQRHVWVQNEDVGKDTARVSFTRLLDNADAPPRSPQESLQSIAVRPGFRVELMASEPMVMDPVNMEWGPDGKLWVVEMADYPLGLDGKGKPGGRVRFLEDRDGDGQYDHSTLFLDEISFPTSVLPWGKGVLVTAAPDLFYAEDTNGDGLSDHREALYRGFGTWNQQHLVNGLRWGLDNWVAIANGDSGGSVRSLRNGDTIDISGRDLRVRPDQGLIEAQNGQSQYSRERDDWGNWFSCNNPNQGWHYALLDHYTRRNPHVAPPNPRVDLAADRRVYPGGRILTHCFLPLPPLENAAGAFTSACGITVYRDELFGKHFRNNTFTSEPIHNAIHRRVLVPDGVTFKSHRAPGEEHREFLSASDPWFRPTTIRTAPDGTLWFADMYRIVLEHPEWIEDELEKTLDLRAGHDRGRLYRVVPVDQKPRRIPRLDQLSTESLVAALDSPSGWQRDTAHRMLVRRGDAAALVPLRTLVRTTHRSMALARLHALCVLDGLDGLTPELAIHALHDTHPGVRRHALRVSETMLETFPHVAEAALSLLDDLDPHVQLQLAYSLGEWNDPRAGQALGRLALRHHGDRFLMAAVVSSSLPQIDAMVGAIRHQDESSARHEALVGILPVTLATAGQHAAPLGHILDLIGKPQKNGDLAAWQFEFLERFVNTLSNRNSSIRKLHDDSHAQLKPQIASLRTVFESARKLAKSPEASIEHRARAARVLGRGFENHSQDVETVAGFLNPQTPVKLQLSLVRTLNRLSDARIPELLLENWPEHTPQVRGAVLDALLSRDPWTQDLFKKMQSQPSLSTAFDASRRAALLSKLPEEMRAKAEEIFGGAVTTNRDEIVKQYHGVHDVSGDSKRGKAIFETVCSRCHRFNDVGKPIAPDLATLANKTTDTLLAAILDPNRAVEDKYVQYVAITIDGRALTGLIANESGNSITLLNAEAQEEVILRKDLLSLQNSGLSQMPEGLEKDLDEQKLADLITYILSERS